MTLGVVLFLIKDPFLSYVHTTQAVKYILGITHEGIALKRKGSAGDPMEQKPLKFFLFPMFFKHLRTFLLMNSAW